MIAASFLFVMLYAAEKLIVLKTIKYRRPLRYLARGVFVLILIVISISRMYFATHFLHQCIFGALMGASVSEAIMFTNYVVKVQRMDKSKWFTAGCLMASTIAVIFWLFKYYNGNPMASVHLVRLKQIFFIKGLTRFIYFRLSNTAQTLFSRNQKQPSFSHRFEASPKSLDYFSQLHWLKCHHQVSDLTTSKVSQQPLPWCIFNINASCTRLSNLSCSSFTPTLSRSTRFSSIYSLQLFQSIVHRK